jgi:hypothetical protein
MVTGWPSTGPTTVSSIEPSGSRPQPRRRSSISPLPHWTGLSNLTPEDLLAPRPTGAGLPKRKFAAQWLRDCLQPGSQTQGSIEIAAERDGVCIATLHRAKFDIGVRSSKDGKSGAWWWTLPHPEDSHPPVNEARCSNELLEHLEHLHETNDLFGNVAKSCVIPPAPACRGTEAICSSADLPWKCFRPSKANLKDPRFYWRSRTGDLGRSRTDGDLGQEI